MIMKHISGRAHDVCVLARGRDSPDNWILPPDTTATPPQFLFPVLLRTMRHGKNKELEAGEGGGGEGKPPQRVGRPGLEVTETSQGGGGCKERPSPRLGRSWDAPGLDGQEALRLVRGNRIDPGLRKPEEKVLVLETCVPYPQLAKLCSGGPQV